MCARARRRLWPLPPPRLEAWARSAERPGLQGRGECPVPGPRRPLRGGLGERASRGRGRRGTRRLGLAAPEHPGVLGSAGRRRRDPGRSVARAGSGGGPSRGHSRGRRKTPRARGRMLGNPRGARTGAREAAAPPPALSQVRGKRTARMRAGDHRPGLGVQARVGAGVAGASHSGEVGEGPEDGRRWPEAPGGAGLGKRGWRGGGCRGGGGGRGRASPGGGVGRGGGGRRSRPRGAGVVVGGRSATTPREEGGRRPRGLPVRGRGGWDSAAAPCPEDDDSPRCPRGDRRGGHCRSRGAGGCAVATFAAGTAGGPRVLGGWPGPARCASEARGSWGRRRRERGPSGTGTRGSGGT